ncbi:MAG: acyl-CoA dehydrogenase, partial [Planctomycetota bacterium]
MLETLFHGNDELKMIQETARDFAEQEIKPFAAEWEAKKEIPREIIQKLADLGFMGMVIPEEYGGSDIGHLASSIVMTEISKACASTAVTMSVHNSLVAGPISHFGTEEQKKKYFPPMAKAEILGAYCLSEPDAGSDAASLSCKVRKDGDYYYLTGTKTWITNGAIADLFIVFATMDKEKGSKGICAFLVEKDFPGLKITKPFEKLGIRASSTVEMVLEDCRVPKENLLGEEGKGFKIAMHTLDGGRIGIASQALGIGLRALEESVLYAKERKAFGQPIAKFQAI